MYHHLAFQPFSALHKGFGFVFSLMLPATTNAKKVLPSPGDG